MEFWGGAAELGLNRSLGPWMDGKHNRDFLVKLFKGAEERFEPFRIVNIRGAMKGEDRVGSGCHLEGLEDIVE